MKAIRAVLASPWRLPVLTTLVIVVLVAVVQVYGLVHRAQVVPDGVRRQAASGPVNVQLSLGFRPEAFNVKYLQRYANAVSVKGDSVMLFGVTGHGLEKIGSLYWVKRISLLGQDG
jgi:hypothetical protein